MKTLIVTIGMLITSQSFAAKCVISGLVAESNSCHRITTRLDVSDADSCESLTKATKENRFFNILEKKQELLTVRYKFVDRPNRVKIKKEFKLTEDDTLDRCLL